MRADLHIHTVYSDGAYTPAQIAAAAKQAGLGLLSMTDHDSLAGLAEKRAACEALAPEKGVGCVTLSSLCGCFTGEGRGFAPCTARACVEMLDYYGVGLSGRRAAVLGRSLVIGRPAAMLLLSRDATVTICHSRTPDAAAVCREADILIAAVGRARIVDPGYVNKAQTVIDVGVNRAPDGSLCGDVDFERVEPLVGAITPVPHGVGAVTTAVLCRHVAEAAEGAALRRWATGKLQTRTNIWKRPVKTAITPLVRYFLRTSTMHGLTG